MSDRPRLCPIGTEGSGTGIMVSAPCRPKAVLQSANNSDISLCSSVMQHPVPFDFLDYFTFHSASQRSSHTVCPDDPCPSCGSCRRNLVATTDQELVGGLRNVSCESVRHGGSCYIE